MKIHTISVAGFGVWRELTLENLSGSLNVLYGCNEAGKTTLMQFLRAMFYGTSVDGRSRYLDDSAASGVLGIETRTGHYEIQRNFRRPQRRGERLADRITVASDGAEPQGAQALQVLLSGVDEAIYRNVYAIGLRELQQLGALKDTAAASYLYDLSVGMDRVSLVEVLRKLRLQRQALLGDGQQAGEIGRLLQQKAALEDQQESLREILGRYRTLSAERSRLSGQVAKMQGEVDSLASQVRIVELACSLQGTWKSLQTACEARAKMKHVLKVRREDVLEVERLEEKKAAGQRECEHLQFRRGQIKAQIAALPVNESVVRQGPRIDALGEQRAWLESIENEIGELVAKADALEGIDAIDGVDAIDGGRGEQDAAGGEDRRQIQAVSEKARNALPRLRDLARTLKASRAQLRGLTPPASDIPPADRSPNGAELAGRLESAHARSSDLRRRIQLDERLRQMADAGRELELVHEGLLDRKLLSPRVLVVSGGLFAFGVMLICSGLFLCSVTSLGGLFLTLVGIGGSVTGGWMKRAMERAQDRELDACERQRALLNTQAAEAEAECRRLDAKFPGSKGPYAVQLRQLEKEMVLLEEQFAAEETERRCRDEAEAMASAVRIAREAYQAARRQWHRALHDEGLPANLSPAAVRRLAKGSRQLTAAIERAGQLRAAAQAREHDLSATVTRIDELLSSSGLVPPDSGVLSKIDTLVGAWVENRQLRAERAELRRKSWQIARTQRGAARELAAFEKQRQGYLSGLGVSSGQDLQLLGQRYAEARRLEKESEQLEAELITATSGVCDRSRLDEELVGVSADKLERQRDRLSVKRDKADGKLKDCFERRGRLGEQLLSLGNDRRDAVLQLELARVEKRLFDAVSRWRDLALTTQLLDSIRRCYEQQRQPAALQEASLYLERLTEGRYLRVWTRLDEEALCVDDAEGRCWSLDLLSSGTREQLFLALRLAIITQYAQRGIRLPLVLDDVLVNFDAARAQAAADVLRDFADAEQQIFVFTCHEHIVKLFESGDADLRQLPDCRRATAEETRLADTPGAGQAGETDPALPTKGRGRNQAA
jgi:uncharacterized protein YhaN